LLVHLDLAEPEETWIEECHLCKQSISFSSAINDGRISVTAEQTK
jgi:hypothetical protein